MNENVAQRIFFGMLLFAVTAAFIWLVRGFMQPIFWAVALAIVFYPLHAKLGALLKGRHSLAAALSVTAILIIVVLPLAAVVTAMAREATGLVERIENTRNADQCQQDDTEGDCASSTEGGTIDVSSWINWIKNRVPVAQKAFDALGISMEQLKLKLSSAAVSVSQFLASQAVAIGQNTIRIAVYFFLMLYLLYFFLRDGIRILDGLVRALPFGDARERHLLDRFAAVSRATIKGTLVVGVAQGFIGGVAFAILGIGAPVLWGVVMALLSIIPAVGPALIWLPAAIVLMVNGSIIKGIALIVVGSLVIGLVDNLLRPLLVGRDTKMPDYLILLSTLGGLTAFGLAGVVIGPIIAAFFLSVWEMAEEEYADSQPG